MTINFNGINVFIPEECLELLGISIPCVEKEDLELECDDCDEDEDEDDFENSSKETIPDNEINGESLLNDPRYSINSGLRKHFENISESGLGYSWVLKYEFPGKTFKDDEVFYKCLELQVETFLWEIEDFGADLCLDITEDGKLLSVIKKSEIVCPELWKDEPFIPSEDFIEKIKQSI